MVVAPLDANREGELRNLLASMNFHPGVVNPQNVIVPFGQFDRLHFARFVILADPTLDDIREYGVPPPTAVASLAFLGDCDGDADDLLSDLVRRAGNGLRQVFAHCQGFTPNSDLLQWMKDHSQPPAAMYVNWIGRTVEQIDEESILRNALVEYLDRHGVALAVQSPRQIWEKLIAFVHEEVEAGRLTLTPPQQVRRSVGGCAT